MSAQAGLIQTMTNVVTDGSINTTGGNNDRSDWASVPSYNVDGNESATSDWQAVSLANDSNNFYLRYQMNATTFSGFLDFNQRTFLDTDRSSSSGFVGSGSQFPIGADYMIEGSTLYSFGGGATQTAFSWNFVTGLAYDDFPVNDHEMTLPRASLPAGLTDFNFLLFASGSPEDYYPNNANGGATGDYFAYSTVPEPTSLAVLGLGGLLLRRRRA